MTAGSQWSAVEQKLASALEDRQRNGSFRTLTPYDPSYIDFCSNDYLGLARSGELAAKVYLAVDELRQTHTGQLSGAGGSRLLAGDSKVAHEVEEQLAGFYKADAGLVFNAGYTANCGIFSALPQRGDTILYDELIHASVRDGMRLSLAKSWSFIHNDLQHLEYLLKKAPGNKFVTAEAVYSMDGDECPVQEIVELCEKYNAAFILDEAHSNGLYGKNGEGLAVEKELHQRIFARVLTFGKAPGTHGAFVAGSRTLKDYLINFCRPFIYSTALPVHDLVVIRESVNMLAGMSKERLKVFGLANYFLKKTGQFEAKTGAIQRKIIPGVEKVRKIAQNCRKHKIDVRAVISPTVPEGKERLRIILHAFNTETEIDELLKIIAEPE